MSDKCRNEFVGFTTACGVGVFVLIMNGCCLACLTCGGSSRRRRKRRAQAAGGLGKTAVDYEDLSSPASWSTAKEEAGGEEHVWT